MVMILSIYFRYLKTIVEVQEMLCSQGGIEKMLSKFGGKKGGDRIQVDLLKGFLYYLDTMLFNGNINSQVYIIFFDYITGYIIVILHFPGCNIIFIAQ